LNLALQMRGSACNGWPHVRVIVNDHDCYDGIVQTHHVLELEFLARDHNTIKIQLDNKNNGPITWDTQLDCNGEIVQDKHCVIQSVMLDGMRCPWLIDESIYQFDTGESARLHGWLSQNGHYLWTVPADLRTWMLENRARRSAVSSRTSSLHYHQNYFNSMDAQALAPLLDRCRQALEELDASTGH
jgi:hypothetical protein